MHTPFSPKFAGSFKRIPLKYYDDIKDELKAIERDAATVAQVQGIPTDIGKVTPIFYRSDNTDRKGTFSLIVKEVMNPKLKNILAEVEQRVKGLLESRGILKAHPEIEIRTPISAGKGAMPSAMKFKITPVGNPGD